MADLEQSPQDSAEVLLAKARKGSGAESAREYLGNLLWARLWKAVTYLANCPPDINSLLNARAEVSMCMKMAQDMQLDMANAEQAVKRVKELFTSRPQI